MKHILLVEDDVWLQDLYGNALRRVSEFSVHVAASAEAALEAIDTHPVDIVVLDIFLDAHNGIEFLHEIASYEDTKMLPVIVLSAVHKHDFAMSAERWKQYGVVEHLYKPDTKPANLVAIVTRQLIANNVVEKT